jgi:hypothetical protein
VAVVVVVVLQQYEVLPALGETLGLTTASETLATAVNGAILGGIAGGIATGTLKGAMLGALQGGLTWGVGAPLGQELGRVLAQPIVGRVIAQGFIGGITSVTQGGNFGSGFLAAGVGSLAGPAIVGRTFSVRGLIVSAVLSGTASVLGGGKFENGAITGAFAYMASTLANERGGSVEARRMTVSQYNAELKAAGIAGSFDDPGTMDLASRIRMNQILDASPQNFLDFLARADVIFDAAVQCGCEPAAIRVFINYGDSELTIQTVTGVQMGGGATGIAYLPDVNESSGALLFQWHPHPFATAYPSPTDLINSSSMFAPGLIWSRTPNGGGHVDTWYQGRCIPGSC